MCRSSSFWIFRSVRICPFVVISSTLPVVPKTSSNSSKLRIMNGSPIEQFTRCTALSKNGPHSASVSRVNGVST